MNNLSKQVQKNLKSSRHFSGSEIYMSNAWCRSFWDVSRFASGACFVHISCEFLYANRYGGVLSHLTDQDTNHVRVILPYVIPSASGGKCSVKCLWDQRLVSG
ncbi:hypothetical protein NPIL_409071 [Nephila pilipes]|uniref:Uncharacterized protein n=1 Tax=Nephila pilipes TaxID=299642 RepID=A0A8X6QQM3_NEPPI|nr:hypothetical protein NPIL_409071 [Nephila pilipes]